MVTGGGAMHLNDSICANPMIRTIFNHHEQASAMAAEGYARISGVPAIVCVTTGPGGLNSLNGVFGAFTDSVPMIVLAGQVKSETMLSTYPALSGLRQLGDQEVQSTPMVKFISKLAVLVQSVDSVVEELDKAFIQAISGRPGPVWFEVPIDIQGAEIVADPNVPLALPEPESADSELSKSISEIAAALLSSKRPVILAGTGVSISKTQDLLLELAEVTSTPVVTAWTHDLFDNSSDLYGGRAGTIGTRPGNFVLQNSDLILILGSRLNIRQVSYNWKSFAPSAKKIWIDIDPFELQKPFPDAQIKLVVDLSTFLPNLLVEVRALEKSKAESREGWINWVNRIRELYEPKAEDYSSPNGEINPYHFVFSLFGELGPDHIVACGNASACIIPFQVGALNSGTRMFSNSGSASMGYDLPAAIGSAAANPRGRVVALAGDGSIMMNIQELATLVHENLDVAIIVLDNGGYLSIKQTQVNFFGRESGASVDSGLGFPNFEILGSAFGIPTNRLEAKPTWRSDLKNFLNGVGPRMLVVPLDPRQEFEPRLKSKIVAGKIETPELDDMWPHLPDSVIKAIRESALDL
jgi:acetolactate synthase I/II/III large subunit